MKSENVPAAEASRVRRLLVALVTLACRHPRSVLAVSALLAALSVLAAANCLQYHTQRNDLLSPHKDYQQRWRRYLAEFGDDDDIVAVVKGRDRVHMRQALDALAERVRGRPDLFDRLFYKVDLRGLRDRALLFLGTDEIRSIQDNLQGMGLLLRLGPLGWRGLTLASLLAEADRRAAALAPGKPLSPADEQFFTQLLSISRTARDMLADPVRYRNPWSSLMSRPPGQQDLLAEPQYFFSPDSDQGTLAFLLVRPVKESGSFTAALKPVSAMREYVASLRRAWPELEFGLTGLPVLETDEMAAADHDTRLASLLALLGVALLFVFVYRGVWYPLLTVGTLLVGTAWAMGWLTATVGHLNILSATFAVMLIGMGDYGVLWVMRYERARRSGMAVRPALVHTTVHVAIGNLTAATTLALAFFAAILADFRAVAELGWIAGCGVLLCALACFTVLPAVLVLFDRRTLRNADCGLRNEGHAGEPTVLPFSAARAQSAIRNSQSAIKDAWLPGLWRHSRWIVAGGLVLAAGLAVCASRVGYDHNLLNLQAQGLESVRWELTLIEHTAGASWHALSYTDTPGEALELKARYEQMPEVARVVEVASLVPADQAAKLPLLEDIAARLRGLPERGAPIPHARPDRVSLLDVLARLAGHLGTGAGPAGLPADLRDSLDALHGQLKAVPSARLAEERLQDFEERLAGDLAEDLHRLREVATPRAITADDLPAGLRERYVGTSGKWLLRVFAKECLWDFAPLEDFTRRIQQVDPEATGKPFGTVEGLKAMKGGLERAGVYAFAVIAVVLLVDFRRPGRALLALAPLVLGVLFTLGILGLCGVPLNPANMIAFPLILGVGVDNGVHVLHDYLLRQAEGRPSISHAIGRGVLVKAMTTMIGFGMLMISTERGLVGLGLILTLGVGCSMVTALFLLPAVLHLRDRRRARPAVVTPVRREPLRQAA
jgi:hopanoid biosynthesis associated RND transporter like protein HpnN